jgi:hypothetical protein
VDDALHEALLLNTDLTLELPNLLLFLIFLVLFLDFLSSWWILALLSTT